MPLVLPNVPLRSDALHLKQGILELPSHGFGIEISANAHTHTKTTTYKVGDEKTDETLVKGIYHVHPEHVGFIFL